jgi:serine/threonine-protein kinase
MAMKALSLNRDLVEPVAFLGIIKFKYEWDADNALQMLDQAIQLNPSLFQAYVWQSQILEALNRNDEALSHARSAKQLNPLSLAASLNLGWQMFQAEKYIEASAEVDKLIAFNPGFWGGHWAKGYIYNQHASYKNAINEFQQAVELGGGHSLPMSGLGYTYALAGMRDEALQIIADMETLSKDVYVSPFHIAVVYAGLNEPDLMFEWLERAFQVRSRSLAWLQVFREMKPYHNDRRFQDLLARIGISSIS